MDFSNYWIETWMECCFFFILRCKIGKLKGKIEKIYDKAGHLSVWYVNNADFHFPDPGTLC